jgi:hypothetical protein
MGVALMTIGPALGHDMTIDRQTLGLLLAVLPQKLRAYITHRGAHDDRLTREIGFFSGHRIDGDKLRSDFTPLKSWRENFKRQYDTLMELAEELPGAFGISLVLEGEVENGALRPSKVLSADFVDAPAANADGLFNAAAGSTLPAGATMSAGQRYSQLLRTEGRDAARRFAENQLNQGS